MKPCLRLIGLLLLSLAWAGACSGDGSTSPTPAPTPTAAPALSLADASTGGPYGVGVMTLELVDASRPTGPNRDYAGAPDRKLVTEVWYPAAPSAAEPEAKDAPAETSGGPYPLIIFAHGFSSFRRQSASYAQHLASHGYVVASPDFPGSFIAASGGARLYAVLDQPADVSFVIDELLVREGEAGWPLNGAIDHETIGMTGHSLGGLTTMLTAYGERRDPRIDAILPISPPACFLPDDLAEGVSLPAMIVGGSKELIVPPSWIRQAYEIAAPPKYFVSIIGADHIRFADIDITDDKLPNVVDQASGGSRVEDSGVILEALGSDGSRCLQRDTSTDELISGDRQRELLRIAALPFFDAFLKHDTASMRFLQETLPTQGGIRFESEGAE
ncbi:MAG: hypothetical protein HY873_04945 [Chloroflexi bacterium]|nr:hypothetical protein [Chloroflexota bacterium]